ncbi:hypothetical protein Vadar_006300 [Vaccinium darrowii]|uniref:Uncharacterized protein n=1 Tax=Vaccinium darrowii TaxID=229202 RepID=A0ACB7YC85_9ERIC|nr:hypothetical protein Vadar_006300 [Vaccinium darrowii]
MPEGAQIPNTKRSLQMLTQWTITDINFNSSSYFVQMINKTLKYLEKSFTIQMYMYRCQDDGGKIKEKFGRLALNEKRDGGIALVWEPPRSKEQNAWRRAFWGGLFVEKAWFGLWGYGNGESAEQLIPGKEVFKMSSANFVELSSDEEIGKSGGKKSKRSLDSVLGTGEHKQNNRTKSKKVRRKSRSGQELEEYISSVACTISQNGSSVLDQGTSPLDKSSPSSVPSLGSAPICRQFWKAGNYNLGEGSKTQHQTIAELLDNAVDEIQNGATSVVIDKTTNPQDGNPALLIQDDGGGMDPETIRRCMSFGFSDKKTKPSIGQYGNGFKTGSMRLGADVIVFTRRLKKRTLSQSVGLLSYTFLRQSGHDRIIVPLLDYEFNPSTEKSEPIFSYGKEHFSSNLSVLLRWSPYSTEEMLLKQFDDVGHHGTKIVIYNLWLNDNGDTELDFDFDMEDIRVNGDPKLLRSSSKNSVFDHHIANLYRFSLRVYSSFLYLRLPQDFKIILRGRVVEHHNIADDLKFHEFILYKPHGEIKVCVNL